MIEIDSVYNISWFTNTTYDYIHGSFSKNLVSMALPNMCSYLLQCSCASVFWREETLTWIVSKLHCTSTTLQIDPHLLHHWRCLKGHWNSLFGCQIKYYNQNGLIRSIFILISNECLMSNVSYLHPNLFIEWKLKRKGWPYHS